jgi:Zn-dependent protease with chaperone function
VFPGIEELQEAVPLLGIGLLFVAFLCMPLLLRVFLGLKKMPAGPLRARLSAAAKRLRFRFGDILVWDTQGTVANAMVTGIVPWFRYIIVTDKLIDHLSDEEIEGVFGHEVGHVKHHHMLFYVVFMLTSMVVIGGLLFLGGALADQFQEDVPFLHAILDSLKFYALIPILISLAIYMFLVFGYLSRRCERQADLYGSRCTSPQVFIEALEKVAILNGIPRDKPSRLSSWQHGTIGQRVAFLEETKKDPAVEPHFQRRLFMLKWGVVLLMVSFSAGVIFSIRQMLDEGKMWEFINQL